MPATFAVKGILPLQNYQTGSTDFLDLATGDKTKILTIEQRIDSFASSPDQQTLAYKTYASSGISLSLTDALGKQKQIALTGKADFSLYSWLNNQQLLLGKDGKWVILNPSTGQEISYSNSDFPDYDTDNAHDNWVTFDPSATMSIYKHSQIFLVNMKSKQITARITDGFDRTPVAAWARDGSEAAVVGTTVVGKNGHDFGDDLFGVARDGQITQLTFLSKQFGAWLDILSLSWSPDSRYVAFWMRLPGKKDWQLAVLDTATKTVSDYCITTDPYATMSGRPYLQGLSAPIWSPDGKQVIVELRAEGSTSSIVLVDTTQNIAFQIAQNAYPVGWMLPITP